MDDKFEITLAGKMALIWGESMKREDVKLIREFSNQIYFKIDDRAEKVREKLNEYLKQYHSKKVSKKEKERIKKKIDIYETGLGCYYNSLTLIEKETKNFLKKRKG